MIKNTILIIVILMLISGCTGKKEDAGKIRDFVSKFCSSDDIHDIFTDVALPFPGYLKDRSGVVVVS